MFSPAIGNDRMSTSANKYLENNFRRLYVNDSSLPSSRLPPPVNPAYTTQQSRKDSFENWPVSLTQKPSELAEAGFFYTGYGDITKCFYCDGGLKNWVTGDVPWIEHASHFRRCAFVLTVKGPAFIQRAIAMKTAKKTVKVETSADVTTANESGDSRLCKICYENEANVALIPCGHVLCGITCAFAAEDCPMCRKPIRNVLRLYYS